MNCFCRIAIRHAFGMKISDNQRKLTKIGEFIVSIQSRRQWCEINQIPMHLVPVQQECNEIVLEGQQIAKEIMQVAPKGPLTQYCCYYWKLIKLNVSKPMVAWEKSGNF